ncbi:MAG: sigma-70 family RNA polymerase sigma factor [Pirellulaceae bacterium]
MTHSQASKQTPPFDAAAVDWEAALARHDRWLRTVAFTRLRDAELVDEVMQEVALAAVRQSAPLSDPAKAAPWLYRLTVRQTLLLRRSLGRRRKLRDRFTDHQHAAPRAAPADPLAWLLAEERRQMIRVALNRLPPRDGEILLLKYTENWSYRQIAAHLGVSHSAVEARLHRARHRMRQELAALDVIEAQR